MDASRNLPTGALYAEGLAQPAASMTTMTTKVQSNTGPSLAVVLGLFMKWPLRVQRILGSVLRAALRSSVMLHWISFDPADIPKTESRPVNRVVTGPVVFHV